ncbi:MAG TPA: tRNA (adenosine(37)-N6)-threonylcarbamoyltransferase complex transferase subunit TsaD [Steroidobacteraceae bacterium]|nr:tRNA (adenosine(37)-N6)-threonylcarbamoyltransferase complex transferase subunit TsaD [Steroidobacteraceae bacterium]
MTAQVLNVLALESSCDETAVAVFNDRDGLVAHRVYTQTDLHEIWGGVVPELASRDHVRRLAPMIVRTLEEAGLGGRPPVGGVAYTAGPGLIGALLVGAGVATSLAYAWNVPVVGIHHLEGHLLAPQLEPDPPGFPYLALLVSGGHTMLVDVAGVGRYRVLGESLDDAAGEAFDKTAKLLGLPYPGGARLAALAESGRPGVFEFPRPMLDRPGLDFSFSGLKTAALLALRGHESDPVAKADLARGFEEAIVDTLAAKARRALAATGRRVLVVAGGVGANRRLRARLAEVAAAEGVRTAYPRAEFCTDNAAMIAFAGHARLQAGERGGLPAVARARWPLEELRAPG